jgi:Protein of unknown function (DUF2586)
LIFFLFGDFFILKNLISSPDPFKGGWGTYIIMASWQYADVSITLENGNLGQVTAGAEGNVGMIITGVTLPTGSFPPTVFLKRYLFTSLKDVENMGFTAATSNYASNHTYFALKNFFDAADSGTPLYVIFMEEEFSSTLISSNPCLDLLCSSNVPYISTVAIVINELSSITMSVIANSITGLQTKALDYTFTKKHPLLILVEGYRSDLNTNDNLMGANNNRVAVVIGSEYNDASAAIGTLLGRIASIPVHRHIGRVKDGPTPLLNAWYNNENLIGSLGQTIDNITIESLGAAKGYVTLRTYPRKSGIYFANDPTCTQDTDDYSSIARVRMMNKVMVLVYDVYFNQLLEEILIDATGKIAAPVAKYFQAIIENAVNTAMTQNGEISTFRAVVNPAQNILSTGQLCVDLYVRPVGYAREICVQLGFEK